MTQTPAAAPVRSWKIYQGDSLEVLRTLPGDSVQCVVTSPPYWNLRDYGVEGQIGLEADFETFLGQLVEVFREVRRVLRPDGVIWVNMGDCYVAKAPGNDQPDHSNDRKLGTRGVQKGSRRCLKDRGPRVGAGLKPKDLVGQPWELAFALRRDGWYLRSDVIWHKPAPMPEPVTDRPTRAHEYIFLLTKAPRYFYDEVAVREPFADERMGNPGKYRAAWAEAVRDGVKVSGRYRNSGKAWNEDRAATGRHLRSVWMIASQPFPEAHFATFPPALAEKCILAGTSARGACPKCGRPWERILSDPSGGSTGRSWHEHSGDLKTGNAKTVSSKGYRPGETIGWDPGCDCEGAGDPIPCTVLDPFSGAGTTGLVATRLERSFIGIELNPDYVKMAERRIVDDAPLLNWNEGGDNNERRVP